MKSTSRIPIALAFALSPLLLVTGCGQPAVDMELAVEPGVSLELAEHRAAIVSDINYRLILRIPEDRNADVDGFIEIEFSLVATKKPLQLDFREATEHLLSVRANGEPVAIDFRNEHLLISPESLKTGRNSIEIDFTAGSTSLNRNPEYLYTLFVPDRARTAFPLFDQPNLKATYELTLEVPAGWAAISNAPVAAVQRQGEREEIQFERSDLISSYLFSFVAGEFETVVRDVDGREITMLHRETDAEKVARNVDEIFNLHAAALDWLEDYTAIDYPFKKFGFALIPAFQYGGMEHVGAIQYRSSSLMLEEAPSETELLSRASLISHEVAHMWFGDLVTMDWFNDVWTKEVFANFMAAKMVNPSFPDVNHELNFLIRHYPRSYSVDRTTGANAIRQHLPNLNEAGQMYGAIIYNKAPIMMRELELKTGETKFREGMQEYLETYSFDNASWPDLIEILDRKTDADLETWSDEWVNQPGRPEFDQRGDDMAYGLFPADPEELDNWQALGEVARASTVINAYENLLSNRGMRPADYLDLLLEFATAEQNMLILDLLLGQLRTTYWLLLDDDTRTAEAPLVETVLWGAMLERTEPSERKTLFLAFADIALTTEAIQRVQRVWAGDLSIDNLPLGETDLIDVARTLAIKLPLEADAILDRQLENTENPDNVRMLTFIRPSLSAEQGVRDRFFGSLADESNRETESWVLTALEGLHHPLRVQESERYLLPSLELLQEIQVTGDIFFPKRWLDETLTNYRSASAVRTVRTFLGERPDYNAQLRMKILQAADMMFRAHAVASAVVND
ncbi:MAG: M1 family aminopeptidase [Pseudomonadota bacterium]